MAQIDVLDAAGVTRQAARVTNTGPQTPAESLSVVSGRGALTDRSGSITTGGTAQQLMGANSARVGFAVQNVSTGDLWINETGAASASQPSFRLPAGAYYETPAGYGAVGAVSIFGANTGQSFSAREW